jgi:two-component system, cell cycle sensor histidine kinase and response regulator CckA
MKEREKADAEGLRRRAENNLKDKSRGSSSANRGSPEEPQRLVHELHVHQIELELQNEELQEARARLEAGLAQYSDLYDFAPVGYLTLDSDGVIRKVNLTGARLLGRERSRLVGAGFGLFVSPGSRVTFNELLRAAFEKPAKQVGDLAFFPENGAPGWVHVEAVGADGGHECRVVLIDVSEQRRIEEQLRGASRMEAIGRLAGGIAHDFNNLLTVIINRTNFAMEDVEAPVALRADLAEIHVAADRAAALTRQLLAFSRKQVLKPHLLDLNKIVGGMEGMLRRLLGENIEFEVEFTQSLGKVLADPGQIEQVLMNLACNARDAMSDGGKLTIQTANIELDESYMRQGSKPGPHVMLSVTDTGCGMDEKTRARLFEPFFTTKQTGEGTGLGLATVYGIVKQSGGSIWVRSEPGNGSTFSVYLPRELSLKDTATRLAQIMPPVPGTENILVVEDEAGVRNLTKRILEAAGYTVLTAADGNQALEICEQNPQSLRLMLTDVIMPQMSGKQLGDRAVQLCPELRVLFMSGYTDDAIVHHGVLDAGTAFIGKPFTAADLTRMVRKVLDEPSPDQPAGNARHLPPFKEP